jgi:hypothetical protein
VRAVAEEAGAAPRPCGPAELDGAKFIASRDSLPGALMKLSYDRLPLIYVKERVAPLVRACLIDILAQSARQRLGMVE